MEMSFMVTEELAPQLPAPAFQDNGLMDEISIHPSQDSVFSLQFFYEEILTTLLTTYSR